MDERDVIIVGAGLTGLTLAYYLKKAGKNVLVVEQKKRVEIGRASCRERV